MSGDVARVPKSGSPAPRPGPVGDGLDYEPRPYPLDYDPLEYAPLDYAAPTYAAPNYDSVGLIGGLFQDERELDRPRAVPQRRPVDLDWNGAPPPAPAAVRQRRRRRSSIIPVVAVCVIIALSVTAVLIVRRAIDGIGSTADYRGAGTGTVLVQVHAGDTSGDIGATLRRQDVVASSAAFTAAARRSGRADDFQPGFFTLRRHMSGAQAVALLLDPDSRVSRQVTITEGMIEPAVLARLARDAKLPLTRLTAASKDLTNLGLPDGYGARSAEGFLFPQTYQYDPDVTAGEALQDMISQYQAVARKLDFATAAKALRLTPYQALIVASMVEAEARFDGDRAKVARVVYNRLARKMALGFDSTSAYGARIAGKDPRTVDYDAPAPYNTRRTRGLPPTPIGNPGQKAMSAAVHPAAGDWLYFVSSDKAGHLFFTNSKKAFDIASAKCKARGWGCT